MTERAGGEGRFGRVETGLVCSGSRSGAIDAVRVFGILAVVAGHTLDPAFVRPYIYSWHVPLFFLLSGYFFASHRTLREEGRRRLRTLGRPYVVWFGVIGMMFLILNAGPERVSVDRLLTPFVDGQTSARAFTTFWFITVLGLSVIVLRLLWHLPRVALWAVAVGGAAAGYLIGPQLARTPLSVGSVLPCLIFLLIGHACRAVRTHVRAPGRVGLVLLLIAFSAFATRLCSPFDIKQGDYGTPFFSTLLATCVFFGLILAAEAFFSRLGSDAHLAANRLSYAGLMVILTHPLLWWIMVTFALPVPRPLLFALCTVVPWGAASLALWTPAAGWLTGVDRPKVRALRLRQV